MVKLWYEVIWLQDHLIVVPNLLDQSRLHFIPVIKSKKIALLASSSWKL